MRGGHDPWALQRWALSATRDHQLPAVEAHVLLMLAVYADVDTAECHPSLETLAADGGRGSETIRHALSSLRRRGLLERRRRGPGRPASTRLLISDRPPASGQPDADRTPSAGQGPSDRPPADGKTGRRQTVRPAARGRSYVNGPEEHPEEQQSPRPPAERGDSENGTGSGRANPRALGTNPRAIAARHVTANTAAANARAVAALQPASDQHAAAWELVHAEMRKAVTDGTWELWLAPLELLAVDHDGRLVIAAPADSRAWVQTSFAKLLAACAECHSARARLASEAERAFKPEAAS